MTKKYFHLAGYVILLFTPTNVWKYRQLDLETAANYILNSKHQLGLEKILRVLGCFSIAKVAALIRVLPTGFWKLFFNIFLLESWFRLIGIEDDFSNYILNGKYMELWWLIYGAVFLTSCEVILCCWFFNKRRVAKLCYTVKVMICH